MRERVNTPEAASSLHHCGQPVYLRGLGFPECENDNTEPLERADGFHTEGQPLGSGSDDLRCSLESHLRPSCWPQQGEEVEEGFILGK